MSNSEEIKTGLEIFGDVNSSKELNDAMNNFFSNPSFSTKQKAVEVLLRNISSNSKAMRNDLHA